MAGPHSPNPAVGTDGPQGVRPYPQIGPHEPLEYPHDTDRAEATFSSMSTAYPARSPVPASYQRRRPKRLLIGALLALALIGALTAAIVYGVRTNGANSGGTFSEGAARTAIQGYLNALEHRDVDVIVRNALCGIYDGVKDKRSDQALAKLSSDAFRKQFSQVDVTSIDKVVYWSQYQAQVLFTMQVTPATGGPPKGQVQGVAQLLFQRGQISVCSYVLRTAGQY
ncbi:hypothetical protein F0Q45_00560 [Mycobacterium simiae]|uniref:DUF8174 domain-containing protein n=1 Tax=Mycobacterium simiae TaxID=1784 RepID=A0A5B1BTL4_MYCSI|nr:hypothetical protein [Mycobacterium simiae]KAA1252208.1 hypothetical protein F0Q45_00560 [Mycobacterium simiae]